MAKTQKSIVYDYIMLNEGTTANQMAESLDWEANKVRAALSELGESVRALGLRDKQWYIAGDVRKMTKPIKRVKIDKNEAIIKCLIDYHNLRDQTQVKYICPLCEQEVKKLVKHHYSYFPEKTMLICASCNNRYNLEQNHPHLQPSKEEADRFYNKVN